MTLMKYGGFDGTFAHLDDDPWVNLATIQEFLEDGEALPPDLAAWLGQAIQFSDGNADDFLKRLGLKRARGRPAHKYGSNAWLVWGERVWRRESEGDTAEQALAAVMAEFGSQHGEEVSRSQLQKWHVKYCKARNPLG